MHAIEQSKNYYQEDFLDVVYVGDRHWDYIAAQQLGINFIGIGKELSKHAYDKTLADLSNQGKFFKFIDAAGSES